MAPLCKIEMTLPRVLGSREKRHGGAVDEQARVQQARRVVASSVGTAACRRRLWADGPASATGFSSAAWAQADGAPSLLSRRRGKPSNHRLPTEVRALALSYIRERYADFGPTFAAEKLAEDHGCSVSHETLRSWMIADGLWIDRRHRLASPHQPRRRRDCLGELVQIDGSEHAWFETRGETCTLLAFVDDATSRLMQLRFVASKSAFDYFRATRAYLEAHGGKPVAFYSDKHGIFRVNAEDADAVGGDRITQFGRALIAGAFGGGGRISPHAGAKANSACQNASGLQGQSALVVNPVHMGSPSPEREG